MRHRNTYCKADGQLRMSGYLKWHFSTVFTAQVSLAPAWAAAATWNFNNIPLQRPPGQSGHSVRTVTIQRVRERHEIRWFQEPNQQSGFQHQTLKPSVGQIGRIIVILYILITAGEVSMTIEDRSDQKAFVKTFYSIIQCEQKCCNCEINFRHYRATKS